VALREREYKSKLVHTLVGKFKEENPENSSTSGKEEIGSRLVRVLERVLRGRDHKVAVEVEEEVLEERKRRYWKKGRGGIRCLQLRLR